MKQDELENLWSENTVSSLKNFYKEINSPEKAVKFSKNRSREEVKIYHNRNDKNACVVIPTANFERFAKTNYWPYISRLDTIVVESNGKYFNYAYSMNSGINEALNYGYTNIIISNDDMIPAESIESLEFLVERELNESILLPRKVRTSPIDHPTTSNEFYIANRNVVYKFINYINLFKSHHKELKDVLEITSKFSHFKYSIFEGTDFRLINHILKSFLKTELHKIPLFTSFGIFDANILEKERYDTLFINSREDYDLMIRLSTSGIHIERISFKIADIGGQTMNSYNNNLRIIKDLIGDLILNYKLQKYYFKTNEFSANHETGGNQAVEL